MPLPFSPVVIPQDVAQRALDRFVARGDACHISDYSVGSHGYAQIGWKRPSGGGCTTAHRAAWTAVHGQIPAGMTVDHICKERRCVNVAHLRLLSNFENARRTNGRDWPLGECAHGHPNELLRHTGTKLVCDPCSREQQARYRQKLRAIA